MTVAKGAENALLSSSFVNSGLWHSAKRIGACGVVAVLRQAFYLSALVAAHGIPEFFLVMMSRSYLCSCS